MPTTVILLASSRKGTHLVLTALAQHPEVYAYRQTLHVRGLYEGITGMQLLDQFYNGIPPAWPPTAFSYAKVLVIPDCWTRGAEPCTGWRQALRDQQVRVVHLHRRNMLRWYVSWKMAEASGQWIAGRAPDPTTLQVTVDHRAFARAAFNDWRNEFQARSFFACHQVLHVWYENLVADFDRQMATVQSFLGVEPRQVRPVCYKQQTRPLEDVIANYAGLRDEWAGTPWQAFLEDETRTSVTPAG